MRQERESMRQERIEAHQCYLHPAQALMPSPLSTHALRNACVCLRCWCLCGGGCGGSVCDEGRQTVHACLKLQTHTQETRSFWSAAQHGRHVLPPTWHPLGPLHTRGTLLCLCQVLSKLNDASLIVSSLVKLTCRAKLLSTSSSHASPTTL
jgi:hypothetical protein